MKTASSVRQSIPQAIAQAVVKASANAHTKQKAMICDISCIILEKMDYIHDNANKYDDMRWCS